MPKFERFRSMEQTIRDVAIGLGGIFAVFSASTAFANSAVILGDSIGVGISMASGLPRLAHNSVSIRSADAINQVRRSPRNAIAFLSLGTNDAVGSIAGVTSPIDRIVDAARDANVKLVWIGPPCVLKSWNVNVVKLDAVLQERLAGRVPYVSTADPRLCDPSLRARDGVHFTMHGYQILWSRARAAASAPIDADRGVGSLRTIDKADNREARQKRSISRIAAKGRQTSSTACQSTATQTN
jgi:hypothetical protein